MRPRTKILSLVAALAVVTAACGGVSADEVVSSGRPVSATDPGLAAFRDAGCAACHGQSGQGGIGPAMAGHEEEQIRRQVRAPLGAMPLFTTTELDDDQLTAIVNFVTALDGGAHGDGHDAHGDTSTLNPIDVLQGHHWMALSALQGGDVDGAIHHIEKIGDLVTGEHLAAMNNVVALLDTGELDAARTKMLEMLAGFVPDAGSIDELHLRLALQALAVDKTAEAEDHLGRVGVGPHHDVAQQALETLAAGEVHAVTELLLEALGEADVHTDGDGDHDADGDDHDADADTDGDGDHDDDDGDDHDADTDGDGDHDADVDTDGDGDHDDDGHDHDADVDTDGGGDHDDDG